MKGAPQSLDRSLFRRIGKVDREVMAMLKLADRQKFRIRSTARHVMVHAEDGRTVTVGRTPSDVRSVRNARAALHRLGVDFNGDKKGRR